MSRWPNRRGGRVQHLTVEQIAAAEAREAAASHAAYQAGYRSGIGGLVPDWAGRPYWDRFMVGYAVGQKDRGQLCPTPA